MKNLIFTTFLLFSTLAAMAGDWKYTYGGVEYTITTEFSGSGTSSRVKAISPAPTSDDFVFPDNVADNNDKLDGIEGTSMMKSSTSKNVTLGKYMKTIGANVFEENTSLVEIFGSAVTTIANDAFYDCSSLKTIDMPNLETIGNSAFNSCSSLKTIDMPNLETIGNSAFNSCSSLKTIDMPNLETIGNSAFNGCSALTKINFPSITKIELNAFKGCTALSEIYLGALDDVDNSAFEDCNFATSKPAIKVKCTQSGENETKLTTIFGISTWEYSDGEYSAKYDSPAPETYTITINKEGEGEGTASANVESAVEGANVVLTITAGESSELASVVVKDASENDITLDENKFTMPASNVIVTVVFDKVNIPTAVQSANVVENSINVVGSKIVANGNGELAVFNILGKQVYGAQVQGNDEVILPKGVYIVKFAGQTIKSILK